MKVSTEKRYYTDSDTTNFKAKILEIILNNNKTYSVVLDATYFYPEGGGQPGDMGTIDGIEVTNTVIEDNKILHILNEKPSKKSVSCSVNSEHRRHYMVQHTGQHLVSAVLHKELNIETVSIHLGLDETTIDINRSSITDKELSIIESSANSLIRKNLKVIYHETDDEGLKKFEIRRESKYSGYIRVVELEDYDCVPCGGLHLNNLSEIGLIKISGYEKIRGIVRLKLLIGDNAYRNYALISSIITEINRDLSTQTHEIIGGIETLKKNLYNLKMEQKSSNKAYTDLLVDTIYKEKPSAYEFSDLSPGLLKNIATTLAEAITWPIILINNKDNKLNWILIDSKDQVVDFQVFKNTLLPVIQGKGGGKQMIWQGSGENENLKEFKKKTINFLAKYK